MAQRTRTKKKPPPEPPPPASITVEGFGPYQTPDPSGSCFWVPRGGPSVGNGVVNVDRYRTTVERIEEPDDVLLARMVALYAKTTNWHDRETLTFAAWRRFKADLRKLVEAAQAAAAPPPPPPPPPPDTPADPGPAAHSSVTR